MCGFGIGTIFQFAIFIIVVLVLLALLRFAFGSWFTGLGTGPYWPVIQIVIGGVVAILILLFLWKLAECSGLLGGRMGELAPGQVLVMRGNLGPVFVYNLDGTLASVSLATLR